MDVALSPAVLGQLNTAEARALHHVTDRLSSCGVGRIVNLPQIIVVGEQSAGKSSVLEAISHVRFPVQGGLCTRFATELVLRQAKQTRVDVSVKFADRSKPSKTFQRAGFSESDLPGIIQEAKELLPKDVLRLEIEGPNMLPLTLVDLPGLFHVDTADQSMRGKETVDQLVESYMKQKNSIILVVITASNQLANHIALRKVKEHDPNRERTIGVITKPDLTRPGYTEERTYIQVARNQETANKLKLGWHVLRNRAEDESSLEDRDASEDHFFQSTAWASIPREDLGVVSLRKKLSRVLYDHVRNNLGGVVQDIEGKLRERQEELDRLGNPRSTQEDMRSFLLTITGEFQRLARDGIHGRYNDPFFGDLNDQDHKLRAQLRNFNRVFDHVLTTKGSNQRIGRAVEDDEIPVYLETFMEQYPYDFPDPEAITLEDLSVQLQQQAASNQGREFPGSPNQELVIQLFQKQASPWKSIAEFHIKKVTLATKAFVDQLFRHVIGHPDTSRTTEAILSTCVDPFFSDKEEALRGKLEELLRPYTHGYALPLDAIFHRTMSQRSTTRLADRLVEAFRGDHPDMFEDQNPRKKLTRTLISEVVSNADDIDGGEFGSDKVIDMMEAYYESCLVCDIPDILTPTKVDRMSSERLRELAAESEDAESRREHLQEEIDVLRQGLEQCRRYKPRAVTGESWLLDDDTSRTWIS
ncbi:Dynamin family protein [Ophiocordyceps sinensis CO18]|uniref:Dynamin family protein n=1 Tax=Ophiocordyceps sinensis (strain Co18 / CGMCC 3.14243) TaxID=911162 RepID=T5AHX8_OPHSC|nr:Dynamin family protein [Ophiocordyceps sinensis CO18]